MPRDILLPGKQTTGYKLLELTAISGELPANQLSRLSGGESYKASVITALKQKKLLTTYYRDSLRGYRLTGRAKLLLCEENPGRFSFYLTGDVDTNHIRSEITRRLRLHRIAETTITMMNAGISVFRDEQPAVFAPIWDETIHIRSPSFFNSREIKELGTVFAKIRGARSVGVLLTESDIFTVYNLGDALMKWEYKSEMRTKALLKTVLCRERLPDQYSPDSVKGLLFGNTMELAYDLLTNKGGQHYFVLDGNYENFPFLSNDHKGEAVLKLLCHSELSHALDEILVGDLEPAQPGLPIENDAMENGRPVLLCYTCDLPRIKRFHSALQLQNKTGTIICFDYQADVLRRYCGDTVTFQTIDFEKWERRFFISTNGN